MGRPRSLSDDQAAQIRGLYAAGGVTHKQLCEQFSVSHPVIGRVLAGTYGKTEQPHVFPAGRSVPEDHRRNKDAVAALARPLADAAWRARQAAGHLRRGLLGNPTLDTCRRVMTEAADWIEHGLAPEVTPRQAAS